MIDAGTLFLLSMAILALLAMDFLLTSPHDDDNE